MLCLESGQPGGQPIDPSGRPKDPSPPLSVWAVPPFDSINHGYGRGNRKGHGVENEPATATLALLRETRSEAGDERDRDLDWTRGPLGCLQAQNRTATRRRCLVISRNGALDGDLQP